MYNIQMINFNNQKLLTVEKDIASNPTTMAGLAVKTYDSDVFQNWVNTELIEGVQGINEASSVAIVDNKLSMDASFYTVYPYN